MAIPISLNLLIVDPDARSRMRLKQAAMALPNFRKAFAVGSFSEAYKFFDGEETIDVVVFSYSLDSELVNNFIGEAKQTSSGSEWAYMAVKKTTDHTVGDLIDDVLTGIDGILFEPYSADSFKEMADIAYKIKRENEERKKRSAIGILVRDIGNHLNAVAFLKSRGKHSPGAVHMLCESSENLQRFSGENFELYVDVLAEVFATSSSFQEKNYTGASARVRRIAERKLVNDLLEKYGGEDDDWFDESEEDPKGTSSTPLRHC